MPNFFAWNGKWYMLPPDPTKAATCAKNIKANVTLSAGTTDSQITTEANKVDSSWRSFAYSFNRDAYDQAGREQH